MTKKRPPPIPPPALAEDLFETPRRADPLDLTWLRRPARPKADPG